MYEAFNAVTFMVKTLDAEGELKAYDNIPTFGYPRPVTRLYPCCEVHGMLYPNVIGSIEPVEYPFV